MDWIYRARQRYGQPNRKRKVDHRRVLGFVIIVALIWYNWPAKPGARWVSHAEGKGIIRFYRQLADGSEYAVPAVNNVTLYVAEDVVRAICQAQTRIQMALNLSDPMTPLVEQSDHAASVETAMAFLPQTRNDVCLEIGNDDSAPLRLVDLDEPHYGVGSIFKTRIIGVAMIANTKDPQCLLLGLDPEHSLGFRIADIDDVEEVLPGRLKDAVKFLGGTPTFLGRGAALRLLDDSHALWKKEHK